MQSKKKTQTGPKPDHLKLDGDWKDAMGNVMRKKKPKDGWPKQEKKEKK